MKALNFLEWYLKGEVAVRITRLFGDNSDLYYAKQKEIADFYSQPFKPEMITEYFKGWGDVTKDWALPYTGIADCKFYEFRKEYKHGLNNEHTTKIRVLYRSDGCLFNLAPADYQGAIHRCHNNFDLPKTLNDFIRDCQRAGIELEFKDEIEDKYFK